MRNLPRPFLDQYGIQSTKKFGGGSRGSSETRDERPFRLWNTDGLAWERRGDELVSHSPAWSVPADEVDFVAAFVSPNWVKRGVRLRCLDDTLVTVTEERDTAPVEMPTYDSMLLMADTGWAVSLGRALAADLDVEFVDEIP